MKVSELTKSVVCSHCKLDEEDLTTEELDLLNLRTEAAIKYCMGYTGLTREQLDEHEDITVAVLVLVSDMTDNANMYVERNNINAIVSTILGMHCYNWIPEEVVL